MSRSGTRAGVLVVDDDTAVRMVICDLLAEQGVEVVGEAEDGVEAVELAERLSPAAILLDVRMPRMNGLEAARRIREHDGDVRVVILSAYDDAALQAEADLVGASAFLVKGCAFADVLAAVAE